MFCIFENDCDTISDINLPLGFGMALAQNETAMQKFEVLSEAEKQNVIQKTHQITSKQEMRAFVSSLTDRTGI